MIEYLLIPISFTCKCGRYCGSGARPRTLQCSCGRVYKVTLDGRATKVEEIDRDTYVGPPGFRVVEQMPLVV